ncbi:F-box protein (macronuclear) [Tetrahymena thermophila SB210]|uniref:F-box protein n=1 Tax=Tetrahymena thermophila (strain SB210) TaxID=312017 RepID=I7MFD2_TETTS|nr:F-box protein [Tetrahymena thermophila SB210]EAR99648.2 F-box protein [Tetrahymena thermophila SB210]|eukprot:XP_001019893.2 F-box protein [Tetrahymena thermophila SB210]
MKKKQDQLQKEETKISQSQSPSLKPGKLETIKAGQSSQKEQIVTKPNVPSTQKQTNESKSLTNKISNEDKKTIASKANPLSQKISTAKTSNKIASSQKSTAKLNDKKDGKLSKKPLVGKVKGQNVFAMINKNIIQSIIAFLSPQETCKLAITSKSMYELTNYGVQNIINNLNQKKLLLQQTHNLNEDQLKAIIYLKHFDAFNIRNGGYFSCHDFKIPELKELIHTLWLMVAEKDSEGIKYLDSNFGEETFHFHTYHNLQNATADKIQILDQCLSKYTDEFVENGKLKDKYSRIDVILLQKYLNGIRYYIKLNFNTESLKHLEKLYMKDFIKLDKIIYFYQKIYKQSKERLEIYKYDLSEVNKRRKIKDIPHSFFD